jgi:peptidylprolyl isomerase
VRKFLLLLVAGLVLGLAACGGDDSGSPGEEEVAATPAPAQTEIEDLVQAAGDDLSAKPQIPAPEGHPPAELVKRDIVKGKGPAAKPGDTVQVQYVGVSWVSGQEFDTSWGKPEPFEFPLGEGSVIPGWDRGVKGMRKGGRRLLVIPPDLAYGPQGSPPTIGPDETLVFVVDLERAR